MLRVAGKFVPRLLTDEQNVQHVATNQELLHRANDKGNFLKNIVAVNGADFFLLPKLKSTLEGRKFDTIEEIKENSPSDLKAILKQAFQDCFQNWKKLWGRCISSGGEYFEGDKCN
jgi:hypothetical protein